jgi:hypothetical protein
MTVSELIRKLSNLNNIGEYRVETLPTTLRLFSTIITKVVIFDDEKVVLIHGEPDETSH